MKKTIYIFFISIIFSGLFTNILQAQRDSKIIRDFNETKIFLTKIWVIVQRFDNTQAFQLMEQAKQELDIAENLIFNENRYILGKIHIVKARSFGNQAAKIVLSQPIDKLKKQLDDTINRSEKLLTNNPSDEARYLLNQAKKFRKMAYDALGKSRTNKAQEFYRVAFYFADKSINITKRNDINFIEQVNQLRSNVEILINQVQELISGNTENKFVNTLSEAKKHYADALKLIEDSRINLALKRLRLIEKLLYRIIDQFDRNSLNQKEKIENDLYSLNAFLTALEEDASESSDQKVFMFLSKAKKQYVEAERAYNANNFGLVKNKINLSQRFATKAIQLIRSESDYELLDVESQLDDNSRLLNLQKKNVEQSENSVLKKMHSEALRLTNRAKQLYEKNNKKSALQHLQLAIRIMNKIQRQLDYKRSENFDQINEIKNKLDRTQSLLNKLKSNNQLKTKHSIEIKQFESIIDQATKHYNNQDYEIANEYVDFILQQMNNKLNKWRNNSE